MLWKSSRRSLYIMFPWNRPKDTSCNINSQSAFILSDVRLCCHNNIYVEETTCSFQSTWRMTSHRSKSHETHHSFYRQTGYWESTGSMFNKVKYDGIQVASWQMLRWVTARCFTLIEPETWNSLQARGDIGYGNMIMLIWIAFRTIARQMNQTEIW